MSLGYNRSLYLLPFDHRNSYLTGMFNLTPPLTAGERESVVDIMVRTKSRSCWSGAGINETRCTCLC
jgi:hypothetical protein